MRSVFSGSPISFSYSLDFPISASASACNKDNNRARCRLFPRPPPPILSPDIYPSPNFNFKFKWISTSTPSIGDNSRLYARRIRFLQTSPMLPWPMLFLRFHLYATFSLFSLSHFFTFIFTTTSLTNPPKPPVFISRNPIPNPYPYKNTTPTTTINYQYHHLICSFTY